jgi:site-specific recombinase XerD
LCPSLARKRISPHVIRHTTVTHLLRAGVDINTIRAWLGHVSIDTTNIYAEVDLERKAQMLNHTNALSTPAVSKRPWKSDPTTMAFLRSL